MSKNKQKEYLPLTWVKRLSSQIEQCGLDGVTLEDLGDIVGSDIERKVKSMAKYKTFQLFAANAVKYPDMKIATGKTLSEAMQESMSDLDAVYNMKQWAYNKQVFKFDRDFLDELVKTDNLKLTKDMFDYLPYPNLYIDISDNERLAKETLCEGFFVYIKKILVADRPHWELHICKVTEKFFFNDVLVFENCNMEKDLSEVTENADVPLEESDFGDLIKKRDVVIKKSTATINKKMTENLILQTLTYLSSVEPQMDENEVTKTTYRKPAPDTAPKNKFSEIRQYDVGLRYGNAFRKYKSSVKYAKSEHTPTGRTVRPHTRRGHWSSRWHGKRGDQILRPVYIEPTFVGIKDKGNETEAVVHGVK